MLGGQGKSSLAPREAHLLFSDHADLVVLTVCQPQVVARASPRWHRVMLTCRS
jgi:hypothetical protein